MIETNLVNLGIVRNKNGEVLIVKRKVVEKGKDGTPLTWVFPGGKQEAGETRAKAVEREILAETGYKIKAVKQISLRIHPQFTKIICYFICNLEKSNQIQKPQETDEIEKIKWVKPEKLRSYFTTDLDSNAAKKLGLS